jgi:hypothetical protein
MREACVLSSLILKPAALYSPETLFSACDSFLFEAEKPQGLELPEGLDKLEEIHSPHWVLNPLPLGLQRSASTSTLPRTPAEIEIN